MKEILSIDIESTYPDKQPIEIAIVSNTKGLKYHSYLKPKITEANKNFIYGRCPQKDLSKDILKHGKDLNKELPIINEIIFGKDLIAWWMENDKNFFSNKLVAANTHCAMKRFCRYYGEYNYTYKDYKNTCLEKAMRLTKQKYMSPGPHRAHPDAQACLDIWMWMEENPYQFEFEENIKQNNVYNIQEF